MSHNIKKDVHFINESCPLLVQLLFFGWIQTLCNETYWKVQVLLLVDLLRHIILFIGGVEIWTPSIWDIKANFPSIERFNIPMATFSINPSRFGGQGTIHPHLANNASIYAHAFKHITTLACPLPIMSIAQMKKYYILGVWGESTLWWPPLGCHIVLLFKDVHVWMYPISNFWNIFIKFLHNMLKYNLSKRLKKKLFHFIL